eukprot:gene23102-9448_t
MPPKHQTSEEADLDHIISRYKAGETLTSIAHDLDLDYRQLQYRVRLAGGRKEIKSDQMMLVLLRHLFGNRPRYG